MKKKKPSLKEFKQFLTAECWSEKTYGDLEYDKIIYDWWIDKINQMINEKM